MLFYAVLAIEALHAPRGIDQALLPGVKRVAPRAHFDLKLGHRRTGLERVSARTGHHAAVILGMNSSFHVFSFARLILMPAEYHPRLNRTIPRRPAAGRAIRTVGGGAIAAALLIASPLFAGGRPGAKPAVNAPSAPACFAPPDQTGFAPVLKLAPPGPGRAKRALALLDRQLAFQRKLLFHPVISAALDNLADQLPPRQSTLIRAPSYYSRTDIPWTSLPDGAHQVCIAGHPGDATDYRFTTTKLYETPNEPFQLAGCFTLRPPAGAKPGAKVNSVIATIGGELETDTFGLGRLVAAVAAVLRETYGDLKPPWDTMPGQFNHHDRALRERFRRDLPAVDAWLGRYFESRNLVDEFDGPGGPWVLFNLRAGIKEDSLKPFAHLYQFYRKTGPTLSAGFSVMDRGGDYWLRAGFDRGALWVMFMVRNGMLTPFDSRYRPAGEPIAIDRIERGFNLSRTFVRVTELGLDFGLENVSFANYYARTGGSVRSESRMNAVPQIVAPPGVRQAVGLVAGKFMRTLALGNGGLRAVLGSKRSADGAVRAASTFSAVLRYSPALEILARVADALADANDAAVRADERRLGEELFEAFLKDYNKARPRLLGLGRLAKGTRWNEESDCRR